MSEQIKTVAKQQADTASVHQLPARAKSVTLDMADRFGMEAVAFEATLRATVFPKDGSREDFAAFLLVARDYGMNPITKEIYAFPKKGGGIQPIVGIDGWMSLINRQASFDGMEFNDKLDDTGRLIAVTCRMYRKDRGHPIEVTEYMSECGRNTDPWKQWPARMLRHKAAIQCARYAFAISGIQEPDEFERGELAAVPLEPAAPRPTRAEFQATAKPGTFCMVDWDGTEHRYDDPEKALDAFTGLLVNAPNRDALDGLWESNNLSAQLRDRSHAGLADKLQQAFTDQSAKLSRPTEKPVEPVKIPPSPIGVKNPDWGAWIELLKARLKQLGATGRAELLKKHSVGLDFIAEHRTADHDAIQLLLDQLLQAEKTH